MADLEQIRARVAAASAGGWQRHGGDVWLDGASEPLFTGRDGSAEVRRQADADAELVAHAREDLLELLRLLEPQARVERGPTPDELG